MPTTETVAAWDALTPAEAFTSAIADELHDVAGELHTVADDIDGVADDLDGGQDMAPESRATRSMAGSGTHRRDPDGRIGRRGRALAMIGGGALTIAAVTALLVSLIQGSSSHGHVVANERSRHPAYSATPSPSSASAGPSASRKAQRARKSQPAQGTQPTQPAIVPVVHTTGATPTSHRTSAPTSFTALAGPSCPSTPNAGVAIDSTWYTQSGGWTGNGCSGMFYAKWVHQPGTDTVRTFTWWFRTGLSGNATCKVRVYVPNGSSTTVGANPAPYYVYSGSQSVGSFTLDQIDNHGQWLYAGAFRSTSGQFSVQAENVGNGSVEIAADALIVSCSV